MNLISLLESSITSTIPSESSPTLPWQCYFLLLLHPSSRWRFKLSCLENAFMHLPHENFSVLVWTPLMWRLRSLASAAVNWQDGQSHRYGRVCNFWCFLFQVSANKCANGDCHTSTYILGWMTCGIDCKCTAGLGLFWMVKVFDQRCCSSIALEFEMKEMTGRSLVLGCLHDMHLKKWTKFASSMKLESA